MALLSFAMMLEACSTTDDPVDPACTQVSGTRSDLTVSLDPQARPSIDEPSACAFANGTAVTVHAFGKLSFTEQALDENFKAVADEIKRLKPSTVKGRYVTKATITSTMNPGVPVDPTVIA